MAKPKTGTWNRGRTSPFRGEKLPPEPLTAEEVERLIRACSNHAPTGVRNRALIVVLWRGGLRIGEALALEIVDAWLDTPFVAGRHVQRLKKFDRIDNPAQYCD